MQEEIKQLVDTLNNVTAKHALAQKNKQKIYENKKVSELEDQIRKISTELQAQRNVEADLRKELSEARIALKEKEYEAAKARKQPPAYDLKGIKKELLDLRDANKVLRKETEQKEARLRVEMLGKIQEMTNIYDRVRLLYCESLH